MPKETRQLAAVFEDNDLVVRAAFTNSPVCFVTFTSLNHKKPAGFGEKFLHESGYSAIHFIAKWNHWYQLDQMRRITYDIAAEMNRRRFTSIITYGSSMGGSAALHHSRALNATKVIAFSPQYHIDPEKPPFEQRWTEQARKVKWLEDAPSGGIEPSALKYYFYDPSNTDEKHIRQFSEISGGVQVKVNFAEHHVPDVLKDAGLLQKAVLRIAEDQFNLSAFYNEYHLGRRRCALYWGNLAARALARRPRVAVDAASVGIALSPNDLRLHVMHCVALLRSGCEEKAIDAAHDAIRICSDHPAPWRVVSVASQRLQRHEEAIFAAKTAVTCRPSDPDLHRILLEALFQSGKYVEAVEQARRAIALAPSHPVSYLRGAEALEAAGKIEEALIILKQGDSLFGEGNVLHGRSVVLARRLSGKLATKHPPPCGSPSCDVDL